MQDDKAKSQTTIPSGWDGYPPDGYRESYRYHWIQVSPAVRDVMMWADGVWCSVRFGTTRPSGACRWLYLCAVTEPEILCRALEQAHEDGYQEGYRQAEAYPNV